MNKTQIQKDKELVDDIQLLRHFSFGYDEAKRAYDIEVKEMGGKTLTAEKEFIPWRSMKALLAAQARISEREGAEKVIAKIREIGHEDSGTMAGVYWGYLLEELEDLDQILNTDSQ